MAKSNSIAIIVKHMTGNMRSRWTDFLTTDGEKPDRNRDSEFVDPARHPRSALARLGRRLGAASSPRSSRSPMPTSPAPSRFAAKPIP